MFKELMESIELLSNVWGPYVCDSNSKYFATCTSFFFFIKSNWCICVPMQINLISHIPYLICGEAKSIGNSMAFQNYWRSLQLSYHRSMSSSGWDCSFFNIYKRFGNRVLSMDKSLIGRPFSQMRPYTLWIRTRLTSMKKPNNE